MKTFDLTADAHLSAYNYLAYLTKDRWAWEYARRNKELQNHAARGSERDVSVKTSRDGVVRILRPRTPQKLAERWGLVFIPDPDLNAFEADAIWSHYVFPDQVEVNCTPRKPGQSCDIWERTRHHCDVTHVTDRAAREYLLLRSGGCSIQVRCTGMSMLSLEPVRMKLQISNMEAYDTKLKNQKEALKLFTARKTAPKPKWTKTTQILRNGLIALDSLEQGLSRREIAALIYGEDAAGEDWGDDSSSLRSQLRYVIKKAEALRDGGYLVELLGARIGPEVETFR